MSDVRKRLIERGLLAKDRRGYRVTEAGEDWIDEQIDRLKRDRLPSE